MRCVNEAARCETIRCIHDTDSQSYVLGALDFEPGVGRFGDQAVGRWEDEMGCSR